MTGNHHGQHIVEDAAAGYFKFISNDKATLAEVGVFVGNEVFLGTGASWRTGEDKYDGRTGDLLAVFRAVDELRTQLKKEVDKVH